MSPARQSWATRGEGSSIGPASGSESANPCNPLRHEGIIGAGNARTSAALRLNHRPEPTLARCPGPPCRGATDPADCVVHHALAESRRPAYRFHHPCRQMPELQIALQGNEFLARASTSGGGGVLSPARVGSSQHGRDRKELGTRRRLNCRSGAVLIRQFGKLPGGRQRRVPPPESRRPSESIPCSGQVSLSLGLPVYSDPACRNSAARSRPGAESCHRDPTHCQMSLMHDSQDCLRCGTRAP